MLTEGRVKEWGLNLSERSAECPSVSGTKPEQREKLSGYDSVVKQTSSKITRELQKLRPAVSEWMVCVPRVQLAKHCPSNNLAKLIKCTLSLNSHFV